MASALATTQRTRATRHLLDAADLADSCGLMTLLVGSSDAVLDLAREEARRSADDHLARLLAIADRSPAPTRTGPHLSTGERELLALLPTRDSNDAIATRLGISVNTVKTRLRRLYSKLDVGRRDDAVRVARERGLIE
jgi:ATP/maltotriose-dependent transcriptional regulator MalT